MTGSTVRPPGSATLLGLFHSIFHESKGSVVWDAARVFDKKMGAMPVSTCQTAWP